MIGRGNLTLHPPPAREAWQLATGGVATTLAGMVQGMSEPVTFRRGCMTGVSGSIPTIISLYYWLHVASQAMKDFTRVRTRTTPESGSQRARMQAPTPKSLSPAPRPGRRLPMIRWDQHSSSSAAAGWKTTTGPSKGCSTSKKKPPSYLEAEKTIC